jgi:hypothetical protein
MKPGRDKRDPEKAKRLRLLNERVNVYGQNDKASRKAIPRFKAESNRDMRHGARIALLGICNAEEGDKADARFADALFLGLHPAKRKVPDLPVGLIVAGKGKKRADPALRSKVPERHARTWLNALIDKTS